ncbi:glutathione peroxidase [Jeotgalibacillus salarius]|uniref:Glutathione peroxidase n=1 Tax=Jeotgalibacillus salarius TaxID=546023 RepID=A0A4Y8LEA9_9BACL|nr:glutathione peroxidase [Jeotgalibacillus salarius]TFE00519.1 glutathione peroxidase [Jeotgalibacillus salarius]
MTIYDFKVKTSSGFTKSLDSYQGKLLLIVNTATKCGFTPQLEDLQKLQERYEEQGLQILGFPSNQFAEQEPLNDGEITQFCSMNYGVNFPIFKKINVRDQDASPLFNYLTEQIPFQGFDMTHPTSKLLVSIINERFPHYMSGDSIKWNFTKFLVDRDGRVIERFESTTEPFDMEEKIKVAL